MGSTYTASGDSIISDSRVFGLPLMTGAIDPEILPTVSLVSVITQLQPPLNLAFGR